MATPSSAGKSAILEAIVPNTKHICRRYLISIQALTPTIAWVPRQAIPINVKSKRRH
ncbi:Hypothetical predicted protein [Prunus dulcis]|uniref:Uncharacterized protein n=1 Tax=Prunus dulcis TaxID=3755 RepID=A0A5E4FYG3_PRUDU|nr:Hypothetical predicted protein [Prunus dulcis]